MIIPKKVHRKKIIIQVFIALFLFGASGYFIYVTQQINSPANKNIKKIIYANLDESASSTINFFDLSILSNPKFTSLINNFTKFIDIKKGNEKIFK